MAWAEAQPPTPPPPESPAPAPAAPAGPKPLPQPAPEPRSRWGRRPRRQAAAEFRPLPELPRADSLTRPKAATFPRARGAPRPGRREMALSVGQPGATATLRLGPAAPAEGGKPGDARRAVILAPPPLWAVLGAMVSRVRVEEVADDE